jgi:uncharacterized coiled-coil DUF342 family protein
MFVSVEELLCDLASNEDEAGNALNYEAIKIVFSKLRGTEVTASQLAHEIFSVYQEEAENLIKQRDEVADKYNVLKGRVLELAKKNEELTEKFNELIVKYFGGGE